MEKAIDHRIATVDDVQKRKIQATDESKEVDLWKRRTGWVKYTEGYNREELQALVRLVNPEKEPGLVVIYKAF